MISLSDKWADKLVSQPEAGMGFQIVSVILHNGKRFDCSVVVGGYITQIKGVSGIPFKEEDIADIIITNDKWDFNKDR
jgi:hypothetical protein